jgi:NAD(P)-dependent dehydrogenase (short-subunit alcohol dehydrogenase family)
MISSSIQREDRMSGFAHKLAVVTGGGSGIGRELVRQLAVEGCSVAACDWNAEAVGETAATARTGAAGDVLVTGHTCDVSDEQQVQRFRDELLERHSADHVDLVFSNAGIGGAPSFVASDRAEWEQPSPSTGGACITARGRFCRS